MSSRSINKVVLLGNLTRDPELKYTPAGTAVCTFGLATNRSWTTADGQTKEEAQYHRVVAWQKLAELCGKLLNKGKKVYLEGRITYRSYKDKNDQEKSITEIVLDDFIVFSDGKTAGGSYAADDHAGATGGGSTTQSDDTNDTSANSSLGTTSTSNDEDVNPDDIPF
ncbi:MAG: single-stranded DNA-binding protein [Weeksellaceae bacterium]